MLKKQKKNKEMGLRRKAENRWTHELKLSMCLEVSEGKAAHSVNGNKELQMEQRLQLKNAKSQILEEILEYLLWLASKEKNVLNAKQKHTSWRKYWYTQYIKIKNFGSLEDAIN